MLDAKMLTLAVQVSFLLAIVTASKLSLPLQARLDDCPPYLNTGWSERVCGDICLPVGQFCCGNVPSSPLLYACPIGTVCNNPNIGNNNYLGRCCEGRNNPPIGALDNCQEVPQFPSTSYITGTVTAPNSSPSSTACGAEAIAEGYGYRACGDICLDVGHLCCGFIPGTNQAWSCEVGQTCLYPGSANIDPGSCVYASGYIVPGKIFVASNTTVTSSRPSTTTTSTISSSTPTTTSSSGLTTPSTGGSSESASITAQSSSSSTTSQLPISTASTVAAGSSSLGTVTSSLPSPAFTGAATRHSLIENSVIYALGGLIVVLI